MKKDVLGEKQSLVGREERWIPLLIICIAADLTQKLSSPVADSPLDEILAPSSGSSVELCSLPLHTRAFNLSPFQKDHPLQIELNIAYPCIEFQNNKILIIA